MKRIICALILLFLACPARAGEVAADISEHKIDVSVGFSGADLLVFGAIKNPAEVAVVVTGPPVKARLWTKKRELGIWVNGHPVTFNEVPGFYAAATTGPVEKIATPAVEEKYGLSLSGLVRFLTRKSKSLITADFLALKEAQEARELYQEDLGGVKVIEGNLFRTDFTIPDSAPKGAYKANVYLLRDGKVVASKTVPFSVEHVGIESSIYRLAHREPFGYAFLALFSSLGLGGLAAYLFRRVA